MNKGYIIILAFVFILASSFSYAEGKSSSDLLKEGLLGAGSGAIGGLASGAKGGDIWKGALAGVGVNIVGGALLDAISGEKVNTVENVQSMNPQNAYSEGYQALWNEATFTII